MLNIMPISIATLVYEVHLIIRTACCNTDINEHEAFFKVESEVTVAVVLLPLSSQCFAGLVRSLPSQFGRRGTGIPEPEVAPEVEETILI